jgi:hypothetical protein
MMMMMMMMMIIIIIIIIIKLCCSYFKVTVCATGNVISHDKVLYFYISTFLCGGPLKVAQWLRYCATNRKVAGSIPDGVTGIFH